MVNRSESFNRLVLFYACIAAAAYGQKKSWIDYGGGPDNSHFVESTQISKSNVGKLEVAWSYPYGQTGFNPIVVDDMMYVIGRGALIALDATSGIGGAIASMAPIWSLSSCGVMSPPSLKPIWSMRSRI